MTRNHCVCPDCYQQLVFYNHPQDLVKGYAATSVGVIFCYDDLVKRLILSYKFSGKTYLAVFFAKFFQQIISAPPYQNVQFDFIVFVPLHPWRFLFRGYNQSALLAKAIVQNYDAIIIYDLLLKVKNNKVQSRLTHKQRVKNIKGVFKVNKHYASLIKGKNLLLIDDVYTSGATIAECSQELQKLAPAKVMAISLAGAV